MSKPRPSPDKLLQRVQDEERKQTQGKLKIYLGSAPGVGKTHEMLHAAGEELNKGLDVVIGVVESHGRKEIEAMMKDFEILPRQMVQYHGSILMEFDLDNALRRHPALILIDEMAHTNAPGLRHKKRWQDIKELLDRGINVYTTLNVQHIESLNDDVSQIIHAPVKETVPDSMIEIADTLELVDLPPEELLKRLKEGKVYLPQQADIAIDYFFKKGNLIALREIALRVMAERVGAQVLLYRQGEGIKHIWHTKEKILVCVGPGLEGRKLIRAGRRMATNLQADWIVVYVDTPRSKASLSKRNNAIQNLNFAEQLGAETRVLTGFNIVKEIMNFAREQNITQIMIWKNIRSRISNFFFPNLADEVVRSSGEIDVYIMTGNDKIKQNILENKIFVTPWKKYFISAGVIALITAFNFLIYPFLNSSDLIMMYLLGVILVALMGELGPSILASILSVLAYDFFFLNPFYSFSMLNIETLITLVVMLLVTLIISNLTLFIRRQAESARIAEDQTSVLHNLSKQLASTRGVDKLLEIGTQYIGDIFNCEVIALLPKGNQLVIRTINSMPELTTKEQGIAQWVYELGRMAGVGTDTLSYSEALYIPLLASHGVIGVLRILFKTKQLLTPEQMHLLEACSNQIALTLEVDSIQAKKRKKELKFKSHRAQDVLLQAVSHDLRTPILAALGEASTLIEMSHELDAKQIHKIGSNIYTELEQHNRLINNLLQINYLESGSVRLQKQLTSLHDLISLVINISSKKLENRKVNVTIAENVPLVPVDNILIQEVFFNLIDNAVKFTSSETAIDIHVSLGDGKVIVSVEDEGPGIVSDEVDKLFEKYYRGRKLTTYRGLGLGLAICYAIITAHGGEIWAENKSTGGAAFRFTLPLIQT